MRIYNLRNSPNLINTLIVDRRTEWGNPFHMQAESDRDEVCVRFLDYAIDRNRTDPNWLKPLRGKDLACWCTPKRCHAETLLLLANEEESCQ